MAEHDQMEYDFCVVGAGPAGLCCALRLKQLQPDKQGLRAREGLRARCAIDLGRGARAGTAGGAAAELAQRLSRA